MTLPPLSVLARLRFGLWLVAVSSTLSPAATFYVSPTGSDKAAGTIDAPFSTVQRAQAAVHPGDTVLIRGGTYAVTEQQIAGFTEGYACITWLTKSGEPARPIRYWAYPGEHPVFDCSAVKPSRARVAAFRVEGSWIHLKGFEVTGVQVTIRRHTQSIGFDNEGDHNVYEQLATHDGKAIGFWIGGGSAFTLVLNCDAYRNWDDVSENQRGGNVDGFGHHVTRGAGHNVFRGCRAWFNSDDGFDFINSAVPALAENCWAFYNGYSADFQSLGDGNGFKAGGYGSTPVERLPAPIPRHAVIGSVAVHNKVNGFYSNHHIGGVDFINNSALRNGTNFNLLGREADNHTDISGHGHRLKNNLGWGGRTDVAHLDPTQCEADHNSFDLPITLAESDFAGLDEADLIKPRQPNGDLPEVKLLHLSEHSAAIDRGVNVGRPYLGTAPDLGAFECR
jgi:hypothetical protein